MKSWLTSLFLLVHLGATSQNDATTIRTMLRQQEAAWNRGDLAGYMRGYWEHDSLIFISKNGPTFGYWQTLERYRKAYPDTASMGKLRSELRSLRRLSADYYFAIGSWHLTRTLGNLSGSWTLLFRRIDGKWVIVVDHSS